MKRQATMPSASEVDRAARRELAAYSGGEPPLQRTNRILCGLFVLSVLVFLNFVGICGGQIQTISPSLNRYLSIAAFLLPLIVLLTHLQRTFTKDKHMTADSTSKKFMATVSVF